MLGANVRAISIAQPRDQLSRVTGFDGKTDGSYEINGVPPGDYFVVVEPLAGDTSSSGGWRCTRPGRHGLPQEYFNASEDDCAQDTDPNTREEIPVGAGAETPADLKSRAPALALVIDVTGSMGPELGGVKTGLETMISALAGGGRTSPGPRS